MESHDPLTNWWCVVTWQTKSITHPLWQGLWTWNLESWWFMVTWMHPWNHIFLWPPDHMRSPDKLKTKYFFRRHMASKLCRVLTYGEEKLIMKSHGSDHVIARGQVSIFNTNVIFYKAYTTRVGRMVRYGDRKPPMESHGSLTTQLCEVI